MTMDMKVGEIYYDGENPLPHKYEVLKLKDNYAYLGHFTGDCCQMVACHESKQGRWHKTAAGAIRSRMHRLQTKLDSYESLLPHYEREERAMEARELAKERDLKTMRGNVTDFELPDALWSALIEYDTYRQSYDPHGAEMMAQNGCLNLKRLVRGMRRLTRKGILQITAKHFDDQSYVKSHMGYFTDLMGLFYFNAGDKGNAVIAHILKCAWKKGALP